MSSREAINTEKGFKTPYFSNAIVCNGMVYVSGNIGMDYSTMTLVEGTVADRTKKTIGNIEYVLNNAGSSLHKLVKVNVFLTNMDDWEEMSKAYAEVIPEPRPARTAVAVAALPFKTDVEIECIAHL